MVYPVGIDIRREIKELKDELPIAPLNDKMVDPMARRLMENALQSI